MSTNSEKILRALARELKDPLTIIAREAELHEIDGISKQVSDVLSLLDGYLLSAGAEYGQLNLPLETTGIGSILYEVSQGAMETARSHGAVITTDVSASDAVVTNRRGLKIALSCLLHLALSSDKEEVPKKKVQVVSYRKRSGETVAGVLSNGFELTSNDLDRAEMLYGQAHLPFSTQLPGSGVRLAIAQQLAEALGTKVIALRRDGWRGLGLKLVKSEQLQLV